VESRKRATELYGLVAPLCTDREAREDFLGTAEWSASHGSRDYYVPIELALDVLEHVAMVCAAESLEGTLELLRGAQTFLSGEARLHVLVARTLATAGRLEAARAAAKRAAELGHAHAVALLAQIEARMAREARVGYAPGMLDAAIETASAEPTPAWHAIDLAALLSTRARLLLERGLWAEGEVARASRREAAQVLERIVAGPFPHEVRSRAADALCFETIDLGLEAGACAKAARVFGHLGAADVAGRPPPAEPERALGLAKLKARLARLAPGTLVPVVFRGDEQELLEWARPAVRLLRALGARGVDLLIIDRSASARASALVERIVELAEVEPWRRLQARNGTFLVPCVAALLADRRTPESCPLDPPTEEALLARDAPGPSFLVGRDLDAEIDDLRLYEHPVVLVSFRRSEMEKKGLEAWLKSLSDMLVAAPPVAAS
jgi:hypothetical protein